MVRGGSRGVKKPSLNDLSRKGLDVAELDGWQKELRQGTDRACALVGGAHLDHTLRTLIGTHFISSLSEVERNALFEDLGSPLGGMYGRIIVSHALGDISASDRDQLQCIRRVRNVFAHSPRPISFAHPLIVEECALLGMATSDMSAVANALLRREARRNFEQSCMDLTMGMLNAAIDRIGKHRPSTPPVGGLAALLWGEAKPGTWGALALPAAPQPSPDKHQPGAVPSPQSQDDTPKKRQPRRKPLPG